MSKKLNYALFLFILFIIILLFAIYLNNDSITLWIITEETRSDGMNYQIHDMIEQFESMHGNVHFYLDILPTDPNERETYIADLYKKIEAGCGPDIYLLPTTDTLILEKPRLYTYQRITPLFPDVNIAMRSGIFADISNLYTFDFLLDKGSLQNKVMDSGVINGSRFVMPLRYSIPVAYYFADSGIIGSEEEMSDYTIIDYMESAIEYANPSVASGLEYISTNVFSNLINYDTNEILLSARDVEKFFQTFQELREVIGTNTHTYGSASHRNIKNIHNHSPLKIDSNTASLTYVAYSISEQKPITMAAVKSINGDVIATVNYYGAISSNCENLIVAYQFLRMFLSEEAQWETKRVEAVPYIHQYIGLVDSGWPVRIHGSTSSLWDNVRNQKLNKYKTIDLTDKNIPILTTEIDIVRFPLDHNLSTYLVELNDYKNDAVASDIRIDLLAQEFINSLHKHISS